MDKIINMGEFIGAAKGDKQHMLGKFLYFSLANLLVERTSFPRCVRVWALRMPDATVFPCQTLSALPQVTFESVFRSPQTERRRFILPTAGIISTWRVFSPVSW